MPSIKQLVLFALVGLYVAHAAPTADVSLVKRDYPEIISGSGLPSLASLNLTLKMLYEMPLPTEISAQLSSPESLEQRVNNVCEREGYGDVADALACYKYLHALGGVECRVPAGREKPVKMCSVGPGRISVIGYSMAEISEASF